MKRCWKNYEENTENKQKEQVFTDMSGWRVDCYPDATCMPARLPVCLRCLIAWHTFALELRGAEQKSTAGELFDLSASVSLMHHVETNQQIWELGEDVGC